MCSRVMHDELREIDRIGAFAQDGALRSLLTAIVQESGATSRKSAVRTLLASVWVGPSGSAVAREDIADLALRDGNQRLDVDAVLERYEEVIAATQDVGLVTGLARQRDQAARQSSRPRLHSFSTMATRLLPT